MKSIVEEASSILKAIEKAWERAGNPKEFTVKIFEKAERGFFGLTKKQAKVGIFFQETNSVLEKKQKSAPLQKPVKIFSDRSDRLENTMRTPHQKIKKERRSPWTEEMSSSIETWLIQLMQRSKLPNISFDIARMGNRLHITFQKPIFNDEQKNTALFRNLSYLLLGMLRSRFKKEFRFLKIALTHE